MTTLPGGPEVAQEQPSPSVVRGTRAELYAAGKALRSACPRTSHGTWLVPPDRPGAVDLVLAAEAERLPDLLPLRHGRMARSAFTFFRGAAYTMAADLAFTPASGIRVQCCGDAHLSNFGGFATPERRVIFSINDLDETLPAPWEWDVKRLAASFVVASRDNGLRDAAARDAATTCVRTYREAMAEFSEMKTLELWYCAMDADELVADIKDPELRRRGIRRLQKERATSIAEDIFPKLVEARGGAHVIRDQLPTIFHEEGRKPGEVSAAFRQAFASYRETLAPAYQSLLDRYELRDAAIKVVGIGSVGTVCWVFLLMAGEGDPLFLQAKQARASVLEPHAGPSPFANQGQRVVNGYRILQPASDIFLGWSMGPPPRRGHFFIRQLRDIKISLRVETFGPAEMDLYATWCGRALALSHARSGSSVLLSGYMGKSDTFDEAIAEFAMAYADQNERDHAELARAVRLGKVPAVFEDGG
jgi:uncharacterized protein (DUF2252 family)